MSNLPKLYSGPLYKVYKQEDNVFSVYERNTQQTVGEFSNAEAANVVATAFDAGYFFNGFTPKFALSTEHLDILERNKNMVLTE